MLKLSKCWIAIAAGLALSAGGANAQIVTLEDGNARTVFDPDSQGGQTDWFVDGTDHMFQQWFWIRAGNDPAERSIDSLVKFAQTVTDTNPIEDPRPDTLSLGYRDPGRFEVFGTFTLRGGAPGQTLSDVAETLTIRNISTAGPLSFSFFQYADFDVNGTSGGDTGQIVFNRIPQQWDGAAFVTESVVTPAPSRWQIDTFPTILSSLSDPAATNLNNSAGPIGPGDLSWGLQWDFTLLPGQEFIISKDKLIIPTPGTIGLIAAGGLLAVRRRRR